MEIYINFLSGWRSQSQTAEVIVIVCTVYSNCSSQKISQSIKLFRIRQTIYLGCQQGNNRLLNCQLLMMSGQTVALLWSAGGLLTTAKQYLSGHQGANIPDWSWTVLLPVLLTSSWTGPVSVFSPSQLLVRINNTGEEKLNVLVSVSEALVLLDPNTGRTIETTPERKPSVFRMVTKDCRSSQYISLNN